MQLSTLTDRPIGCIGPVVEGSKNINYRKYILYFMLKNVNCRKYVTSYARIRRNPTQAPYHLSGSL